MHDRDDLGARLGEAPVEVAGEAEVAFVAQEADARIAELGDGLGRPTLRRAVVDDDGDEVRVGLGHDGREHRAGDRDATSRGSRAATGGSAIAHGTLPTTTVSLCTHHRPSVRGSGNECVRSTETPTAAHSRRSAGFVHERHVRRVARLTAGRADQQHPSTGTDRGNHVRSSSAPSSGTRCSKHM